VDAPALASSIAHLNTSTTFSPLQALQDTDVAGYLRHAHEQNLISTIEEGRRETQEDFYRSLEERSSRDWEAKKKRVFEELGGRLGSENRAMAELKKSFHGKNSLAVCFRFSHYRKSVSKIHRQAQARVLVCKCRAR
jgi:nuclear pore complex protein Nup93